MLSESRGDNKINTHGISGKMPNKESCSEHK